MSEQVGQREAVDSPQATGVKTPPEPCPLCRETGPPQPPSITEEGKTNEDIDFIWVACNKCDEWYHSACLFLGDEKWRGTIPKEIISTVETNFGDEGAWTNWVEWIGKWYCAPCLARSTSPSNPRPPRHPLVATMKRASIQPKDIDQAGKPLKRSASTSAPLLKSNIKRPRTSTKGQETASPEIDMKSEREQQAESTAGTPASDAPQGRPKRKTAQIDYRNLNNSIATPTHQWLELIADPEKYGRTILDANYPALPGKLLTRAWLESQPLPGQPSSISPDLLPTRFWGPDREPLIVRPENGGFSSLGGHLPSKDLTVQDVANLVGPDRMVDVIDVSSQHSSQWTLQKWAEYIQSSSGNTSVRNPKVYNVISLEISGTELAKKVKPPKIVREIDWVDNFWRFNAGAGGKDVKEKGRGNDSREGSEIRKEGSHLTEGDNGGEIEEDLEGLKEKTNTPYPKVQLYCLMGMKGAWTDWHVDFAASSVYYTIHSGAKVFFFVKPTEQNLKAYAEWSGSYEKQQDTWLGDMVDEVRKVELHAGDTMIIPTGYIHAVYTPMDSIVFGGNFLHSYNVDTQLRLRQIEIDTKVPQRFRFPMFDRLCWYVAEKYCSDLRHLRAYRPRATTTPKPPHFRVLQCLSYLANFLVSQTGILEDPEAEDKARKLVHDRIPGDIVKDPEGLAKELKWRVERELGALGLLGEEASGVEAEEFKSNGTANGSVKIKGKEVSRKRDRLSKVFDKKAISRTWDFHPPAWSENRQSPQIETTTVQLPRPSTSSSDAISGSGPGASPGASANGGANENEQAELTTMLVKQTRKRMRELDDGTVIEESQETTFVEKKTIWGPKLDKEKISQPQGKVEEDMDIDH
ncbi:conserved hypothetical protein [Cryptococcus deneoformans JEC21]|uniref:JmjC domain-containing histone demethylation protein 1 n=1 Tax=Cryptococcus deneoformans (strain JEC21 / ATCC MYA-565) TaxID=214684 RepID=JHD1_CRYD1|nr:conserved hypothetical protein [Cryptococcus neoformans var. neoformans JEC21]AAW44468.2 conserved hypothetical protein [Cryptococcus neoformans var. neoformans JEC21]